jgi:hypothetical protein
MMIMDQTGMAKKIFESKPKVRRKIRGPRLKRVQDGKNDLR